MLSRGYRSHGGSAGHAAAEAGTDVRITVSLPFERAGIFPTRSARSEPGWLAGPESAVSRPVLRP